jgi:hypothetical protein
MAKSIKTESGLPNAAKFMREVLRGSTYSFPTAIADLVDNSIQALASEIEILVDFEKLEVILLDNGSGMSDSIHSEAMKIASETREYSEADLGKYGTGMKAASLSQAARLIVATREKGSSLISVRCLDMEHINRTNDWSKLTLVLEVDDLPDPAKQFLGQNHGTAVVWQHLDRAFAHETQSVNAVIQELKDQTQLTERHLAMVFHRFLSGEVIGRKKITLRINGNKIEPWDPFVRSEKETTKKIVETKIKVNSSTVVLTGYVLPTEKEFSSRQAFQDAAGPRRWNEGQGFYVYRNNRLIRWGGWLKTRASDEHTKFARISLDFTSELDPIFQVNVAKSSLVLPNAVKAMFADTVAAVTSAAQKRYRLKIVPTTPLPRKGHPSPPAVTRKLTATALVNFIQVLCVEEDLQDELNLIKEAMKRENPNIASEIGWL